MPSPGVFYKIPMSGSTPRVSDLNGIRNILDIGILKILSNCNMQRTLGITDTGEGGGDGMLVTHINRIGPLS